jgi:2-C-methyl-D-erythritol 4-phosphate cytidylyltransferase
MGDLDKVWERIGERPVLWHAANRLMPAADLCVLVVQADRLNAAIAIRAEFPNVSVVVGGQERQDSVRHGLDALEEVDVIAVHDAARPLADADLLRRGIPALSEFDGAVPVVPLPDTIKQVEGSTVVTTVDRQQLRATQTPQLFRAKALRESHRLAASAGWSATDDAQLLEIAGFRVGTFPGEAANLKITTQHDLRLARLLIGHVP